MTPRMIARQKFVDDGIAQARADEMFSRETAYERAKREAMAREFLGELFDKKDRERHSCHHSDILREISSARTWPDFHKP